MWKAAQILYYSGYLTQREYSCSSLHADWMGEHGHAHT